MGALGSDAAVEAADIVLMDDDPLKIPIAVGISKKCLKTVKENIYFAIGVKLLCLVLGALYLLSGSPFKISFTYGIFSDFFIVGNSRIYGVNSRLYQRLDLFVIRLFVEEFFYFGKIGEYLSGYRQVILLSETLYHACADKIILIEQIFKLLGEDVFAV